MKSTSAGVQGSTFDDSEWGAVGVMAVVGGDNSDGDFADGSVGACFRCHYMCANISEHQSTSPPDSFPRPITMTNRPPVSPP